MNIIFLFTSYITEININIWYIQLKLVWILIKWKRGYYTVGHDFSIYLKMTISHITLHFMYKKFNNAVVSSQYKYSL